MAAPLRIAARTYALNCQVPTKTALGEAPGKAAPE